jgi:membrane protein
MYYYAPDPRRRAPIVNAGVILATVAWLLFSAAFSLVLNHFVQFLITPLYGWFTGLIVLLMYLYWSSVILLVCAEVNRVIASHGHDDGSEAEPHEGDSGRHVQHGPSGESDQLTRGTVNRT